MRTRNWTMLGVAAAAALALAPAAQAATRVVLGPVRGPGAAARSQIYQTLCASYECVGYTQVYTAGKPDLAKARRLNVAGILSGAVRGQKGSQVLVLALHTRSLRPDRNWNLPLNRRGLLPPDVLDRLLEDVEAAVGPARPLPSAPPAAAAPPAPSRPVPLPPPPAARPAPPPAAAARPAPAPAPAQAAPVRPAPRPAPPPAAPPAPAPDEAARPPVAAVDVGVFFTGRTFKPSGLNDGARLVRDFKAPGIVGPRLRVELYPAAFAGPGLLSGLGLFADYSLSVGLKTEDDLGRKLDTSFSRLELGGRWRLGVTSWLTLTPAVSYEMKSLTVKGGIAGLPDAQYAGPRAALQAEVPVTGALRLHAGAAFVQWTTAQDLVKGSPRYFPEGSAYGVDAEAGASWAFTRSIAVAAMLDYSHTRVTVKRDPADVTYNIAAATDDYLGGRVVLRGQY